MKKWGRIKISHALESKGISPNCIRIGLKEIDETSYVNTLRELLEEKSRQIDKESIFVLRDRISKYAIQKGYEPEIVWTEINQLFPK